MSAANLLSGDSGTVSEENSNWIVSTGQAWKLYVAIAGFAGSLLCFTVAFFSLEMSADVKFSRMRELSASGCQKTPLGITFSSSLFSGGSSF